jgi:hypothetical protein
MEELKENREAEFGIPQRLKLRLNQREEFVVENLFLFEAETADEAFTLFNQGVKNKVIS